MEIYFLNWHSASRRRKIGRVQRHKLTGSDHFLLDRRRPCLYPKCRGNSSVVVLYMTLKGIPDLRIVIASAA